MSLARSSITPTGSVVRMMSTVTSRGVLNPGPKSRLTRSYVVRGAVPGSEVPVSGRPSARSLAGSAITSSTPIATTAVRTGTLVTRATHLAPSVCVSSGCTDALRAAREPGFGRSRSPASASIAGTTVRATATATATAAAAAKPMTARNGIRATTRPHSAMTTVAPAKITALPAVPSARAIDSGTGTSSTSWARWRETMNRA